MTIPKFYDKFTMKAVREESLNKAIDAVNALDPKVKGLQEVVALTMTQPEVDVDAKKITFKRGGEDADAIDLGPLLDSFKHGVDVTTDGGGGYDDVEKLQFKNSTLTKNGDIVTVDFKPADGQVGDGVSKPLKQLFITGNTNGSSMSADGKMTLNMPSNSIKAMINGNSFENIDKIRVLDSTTSSNISGDTLNIKIPDPIKGSLLGGTAVDVKSLNFIGNIGNSRENDGAMVVELPGQEVDPGDGAYEVYHKIKLKGNIGESKVVNQILELDLPTGGSGGPSDLKVGIENHTPVSGVGEIWFKDSEIKVDQTTRSNAKVLISHKGAPVSIEDKGGTTKTGNAKLIKLTGDVETSDISDTGQLTINIPHHAGLSVSDGTTTSKGISELAFPGSTVTFDSAKAKAIITADGIKGKMNGVEDSIKEIEITGTIGGSTLAGGKLKIDLPAGGGGTGGADITGVVGSDSAKIERIEVIGAKYNSSVTESTKTLKIDIPRKVAIKGGADVFSDIDMVEVANSTVQLDVASGTRKAFITPHIPFMFYGWFQDMTALNNAIPVGGRIPTKTCAYVPDPRTRQNTLWMWLPNAGTGISDWVAMPTTGSLALVENNHSIQGILGIQKNPMIKVDDKGLLTVEDTTVPEVLCKTLDQDGRVVVKDGKFNEIRFEDGEGVVAFDPSSFDLKIHRAQRRFAMGADPDTISPSYTEGEYEGSIWLNKTDGAWWGFNNKDVSTGEKKWTKVLHRGMSDDVNNLTKRVPQVLPSLEVTTETGDHKSWAESGWTHLPQGSMALPAETRQKTGGYIETFVIEDSSVTGGHHRSQILHIETDAATYKRFWTFDLGKWSTWVKTSFNPFELKAHNEDDKAHKSTHPYYKSFTFGCKYAEIAAASMGDFQYVIEKDKVGLIGTDGRKHRMDGDYIRVPYEGKFDINGMISFGGASNTNTNTIPCRWYVELQKCPASSAIYTTIATEDYHHGSTTLKLPPLIFKFERVDLQEDDNLRIKIRCAPDPGHSEASYLTRYKDLYIMPGRSYLTIDEDGNQTGLAIGKAMSTMYGGFVSLGGGAFGYETGAWPNDVGHVVGDTLEDPVYM